MKENESEAISRIGSYWVNGQCPIANGIFYSDDTFVSLSVSTGVGAQGFGPIRRGRRVSLDVVSDSNGPRLTYLNQLCEARSASATFYAVAGEGAWGSEGFVALLDVRDNLVWLAFFDFSNPFSGVQMCNEAVVANSTADTIWRIPIWQPEMLNVQKL